MLLLCISAFDLGHQFLTDCRSPPVQRHLEKVRPFDCTLAILWCECFAHSHLCLKHKRPLPCSGVSYPYSHASNLGSWGQCGTDHVTWDMGACHWLHGVHDDSVEYEHTAKQSEQEVGASGIDQSQPLQLAKHAYFDYRQCNFANTPLNNVCTLCMQPLKAGLHSEMASLQLPSKLSTHWLCIVRSISTDSTRSPQIQACICGT